MAVDYFMKVDGIDGESQDSKHRNEIDVLSFHWGVTQTGAHGAGGGAGAGKAAFNDFSIVKLVDTATAKLMLACCAGRQISEATFTARKAGDVPLEYLKIKLTDLLISGVVPAGTQGNLPMEQVSFAFGSSSITTTEQDPKGGAGPMETIVLCDGSIRAR
jgi:type VI secretion system secreted protein Hcp